MNWSFLFPNRDLKAPDLNVEVENGNHADALLNSNSFQSVMRRVREGVHIRWASSPITDLEGQHELRLIIKVLDDIEGTLHRDVDTGKLALNQLEKMRADEKRRTERAKRSFIRAI